MPTKPLWLKKLLAWLRVALFTFDTGSDLFVGIDLIKQCHYGYGAGVLSLFWLPGFVSGGYFASLIGTNKLESCTGFGYDSEEFHVAEKRHNSNIVGFLRILLFIIGTVCGPLVFLPGGFYLLVKAALNPEDQDDNEFAK